MPNLKRAMEHGVDRSERPWASWRHFVRIRGILKSGGKRHTVSKLRHTVSELRHRVSELRHRVSKLGLYF